MSVDPRRLSYTGRDIFVIDREVDRYIGYYLPEITDTSKTTGGRIYVQGIEGLVDLVNYQEDRLFNESLWAKFNELRSGLRMAELNAYSYSDASADTVDLPFTTIGEVPAASPITIAKGEIIKSTDTPIRDFVIIDTRTIEIGQTTVTASAREGGEILNEILTASASGQPHQKYRIAGKRVVRDTVEVTVAAEVWTRVDQFYDDPVDALDPDSAKVYRVVFDADHNAYIFFGDNKWGRAPESGAAIDVDYWKCNGLVNKGIGTIEKIVNSTLAAQVICTNNAPSAGGSDGKTVEEVRFEAPATYRTKWRGVNKQDYIDLAKTRPGVYQAAIAQITGSYMEMYLIPYGGGQASSEILDDVKTFLAERALLGAAIQTYATEDAAILLQLQVHLKDTTYDKGVARQRIYDTIAASLHWRVVQLGQGFKKSDLDSMITGIDDGALVGTREEGWVDIIIMTRIPRIEKSNELEPDILGGVTIKEDADYARWVLTALTPVGGVYYYSVTRNGFPLANGEVGVLYETDEISFTLGELTDVLTVGETWIFNISRYDDNIQIENSEIMVIRDPADIEISLYYPGEEV